MPDMLGHTFRDKITQFEGVCTGYCEYLSGCHQALIVPKVKPDGTMPDSHWFDVQRLTRIDLIPPVTLNNGETPGCDMPAPKR